MSSLFSGSRRRLNLLLDVAFLFLLAHLILTGEIIPAPLADLLHNPSHIQVVVEPTELVDDVAPALEQVPVGEPTDPA